MRQAQKLDFNTLKTHMSILTNSSYTDTTSAMYKNNCRFDEVVWSIFLNDNGGTRLVMLDPGSCYDNFIKRQNECINLFYFIETNSNNYETVGKYRMRLIIWNYEVSDSRYMIKLLVYKTPYGWLETYKHRSWLFICDIAINQDPKLMDLLTPQHWLTKALGLSVLGAGALYIGHRYSKKEVDKNKIKKMKKKEVNRRRDGMKKKERENETKEVNRRRERKFERKRGK